MSNEDDTKFVIESSVDKIVTKQVGPVQQLLVEAVALLKKVQDAAAHTIACHEQLQELHCSCPWGEVRGFLIRVLDHTMARPQPEDEKGIALPGKGTHPDMRAEANALERQRAKEEEKRRAEIMATIHRLCDGIVSHWPSEEVPPTFIVPGGVTSYHFTKVEAKDGARWSLVAVDPEEHSSFEVWCDKWENDYPIPKTWTFEKTWAPWWRITSDLIVMARFLADCVEQSANATGAELRALK